MKKQTTLSLTVFSENISFIEKFEAFMDTIREEDLVTTEIRLSKTANWEPTTPVIKAEKTILKD